MTGRVGWMTAALLAATMLVGSVAARAGNLRGRIDGRFSNGFLPIGGASVTLLGWNGMQWVPLSSAFTGPDGFYFFYAVPPGNYALSVNGTVSVPLMVFPQAFQDVPPILAQ